MEKELDIAEKERIKREEAEIAEQERLRKLNKKLTNVDHADELKYQMTEKEWAKKQELQQRIYEIKAALLAEKEYQDRIQRERVAAINRLEKFYA